MNNMYNPGYFGMNPYMYQPMMPMQQPTQDTSSSIQNVRFVDGLEGAQNCTVPYGAKVLLMDSNADRFYIKETDNSGVATITQFEFKKFEPSNQSNDYITREEFEARINQLLGGSHESATKQPSESSW